MFAVPTLPIIVYHSYLFLDFMPKHLDRHSRTIYEANLFNKKFKNFNKDLTFLKCSVELDFEFNVTVDSCMYTNFYVVDFYNLAQFTRLNVFKALNPASASVNISLEPHFLWCSFFSMFCYVFLKNGQGKRLKYLLMVFAFIQSYFCLPSLGRVCIKVKACNQIKFFTPKYIRARDALDNIRFYYRF